MVTDWLQKLLVLQDRDQRCDAIQGKIGKLPMEMERERLRIQALEEEVSAAEDALRKQEARRMDLEGEVAQAEEALVKYKTQQMQVKKNEEYQALEAEIANTRSRILALEEDTLTLMETIEASQEALERQRQHAKEEIRILNGHLERLEISLGEAKAELEDARVAVREREAELDADVVQQYRYVKGQTKRGPYVVELSDGKCQGCHLKVSGDIESTARRGTDLVRCDSCGRILYFDR